MFEDWLIWIVIGVAAFILLWLVLGGLSLVGANQVGILTKKMLGKKLPQGRIIARSGEVGVQADTLLPGLYYRFPFIWSIKKIPNTVIAENRIGTVSTVDGVPMPPGRLLGDVVECNSFQDAKSFLDNGGMKGPQVQILRPGVYRINTYVFEVTERNVIDVPKENIGIVIANDGIPLMSNRIIAPEPEVDHKHFQDGQTFINGKGYRGPQLETLQPGRYYINPLLFEVANYPLATIPPGYVAVKISSVGEELESSMKAPMVSFPGNLNGTLNESQVPLITDKKQRGILKDPVAPGKYNLNTIAYKVELVPTSAVTIDWASSDSARAAETFTPSSTEAETHRVAEFFNFSQLKVTSKDGFQLEVDVRLIIRIPPEDAPYIIARFGTVQNLIEQVAHPLIDSSFRNEAGKEEALQFVHSRSELQANALSKAADEFKKYHVEVQGLLIAYISVDPTLLQTQTAKQIAIQQQLQYQEEAKAQAQQIAVQEQSARAQKQKDVIAAKLTIDINQDLATAAIKQAEGVRESTKIVAEGNAYQIKQTGQAQAEAYEAQVKVLGQSNVALVKVIDEVSTGKVQITPNILVTGGDSQGSLFNAFMANLLDKQYTASAATKMEEDKKAAETA